MNKDTIWIDEIHENSRYGLKGKILSREKSEFQEIIIIETEEYGNALMLDGCWMISDKQEKYYHECLVHPALTSLEKISKVLIIGGGDGGTARECLKYKSLLNIDLVEIDKLVIDLSKKYLKQVDKNSWEDPRLKIHIADGTKWIRERNDDDYDAIFIDCSDPSEFSKGLFSFEFYKECKRIMSKNGILATQSESPESFKKDHINIINSIKGIFKISSTMYSFVPFYPSGLWSWTFASDNNKDFLKPKFKNFKIIESSCEVWNRKYQKGAFQMMPNKIIKELSEQK